MTSHLGRTDPTSVSPPSYALPSDVYNSPLTSTSARTLSLQVGQCRKGAERQAESILDKAFTLLFYSILLIILYSLLRDLLSKWFGVDLPRPTSFLPWSGDDRPGGGGEGGGGGGGGGPGFGPGSDPPPYSKDDTSSATNIDPTQRAGGGGGSGSRFWTGIATGAAGGYLAANLAARGRGESSSATQRRTTRAEVSEEPSSSFGNSGGSMRRATGFGGSSTR